VLFALANVGLPGTSGFVGEFLVIVNAFKQSKMVALCASLTLVIGACYSLWLVKRVIFGSVANNRIDSLEDISWREKIVFGVLAIMILWLGICPASLLDIIQPNADLLITQLGR
jgi:NADH-quinone oxidoreductase subunit M